MKRSLKLLLCLGLLSAFAVFFAGCGTDIEEPDAEPQSYVGSGFALEYPGTWIYTQPADYIVLFSGAEGTEAYDATVNVQTLEMGEFYTDLDSVYNDFREQFEGVGGTISEMTARDFQQNGETFDAIEFYAEYEDVVVFNQFLVVVDRGDGYLHQISYTAPENIYDTYESIAMEIIASFELRDVF